MPDRLIDEPIRAPRLPARIWREASASPSAVKAQGRTSDTGFHPANKRATTILLHTEGNLQRCAVEKDAEGIANLNRCEV
jgi:hypothetical protein